MLILNYTVRMSDYRVSLEIASNTYADSVTLDLPIRIYTDRHHISYDVIDSLSNSVAPDQIAQQSGDSLFSLCPRVLLCTTLVWHICTLDSVS